jgi:hypothetical protein
MLALAPPESESRTTSSFHVDSKTLYLINTFEVD